VTFHLEVSRPVVSVLTYSPSGSNVPESKDPVGLPVNSNHATFLPLTTSGGIYLPRLTELN
jgi:hypothetical protein